MKTKILNIKGAQVLDKNAQKFIQGGAGGGLGTPNLSNCGCDCTGAVTGPSYCSFYIQCPQVYTC